MKATGYFDYAQYGASYNLPLYNSSLYGGSCPCSLPGIPKNPVSASGPQIAASKITK